MPNANPLQHPGPHDGQRGLPRLAGLDGIRGLAALAVVLYHAGASWLPAGFLGVDVFFVVSGFLITSLLISERERDDKTDLIEFWKRRARRLLPVLALVLIVTTAYTAIRLQDTLMDHLREVLVAAVYITNWDQIVRGVSYFEMFERPSQLRHLWSLAVEEQFYIIWPVLFGVAARFLRLRWLWCIVVGLAALSVVWMVMLFTPGDEPSRVYFGSDARAFTILIGVAVAFFWKPWRREWTAPLGYLMDALALAALVGIGLIMALGRHWNDWMYPWGLLFTSAATIVLVAFVIRPGSLAGRALEIAPLRWMGERSYSIYLWHWPVMLALQWEHNFIPNSIAMFAAGIAATFILSELSYRLVERPMRRPEFWSLQRIRSQLADARPLATITASLASAVLLALVIGFTVLPGRSPSELLFSASAEQAAYSEENGAEAAAQPTADRQLAAGAIQDNQLQTGDRVVGRVGSLRSQADEDDGTPAFMRRIGTDPNADPNAKKAATGTGSAHASPTSNAAREDGSGSDRQPDQPSGRIEQAPALMQYPPGDYYAYYTVRAGDSLHRLTRMFDISIEELVQLNDERIAHVIHPGDMLKIRCPGTAPCTFLQLDQVGDGCVNLQAADDALEVCRSQTVLVDLPVRLSVRLDHPLSSLPKWVWNGSESEGLDFTVLLDHTAPYQGGSTIVELHHGQPPLAIGDSVMVGAKSQLESAGIEVNAEVGRLANQAISVLKQEFARNGVRDTVIFHAVGTMFLDEAGFERLVEAAKGVRHLIVLTRQFPPREPLLTYERDTNKMLREQVSRYDWITLVDWNEITDGREQEVTWDGTHLNLQGRQLYADHILAAVISRSPLDGDVGLVASGAEDQPSLGQRLLVTGH